VALKTKSSVFGLMPRDALRNASFAEKQLHRKRKFTSWNLVDFAKRNLMPFV
jgi:hypothetical protein